jgi:hypothetical protein
MLNLPVISELDIDQLLIELNREKKATRLLLLDEARRAAIRSYDDVQACPGSGKTTLVGLKLLCLARKWTELRRGICVLTHTNVAKDEILARLRQHPVGHKLLSYPHFIGTIQEFVNTFLGLPACRSKGMSVARIDDAYCASRLEQTIGRTARTYLKNKNVSVSEFRQVWRNGTFKLNVPGFECASPSQSYRDLIAAKSQLFESGLYFYSEMYAFARELIAANPAVNEALRHRFPVAIIDEMQDAQKFQDELINLVFGDGLCLLQRMGDPDQSIFDGLGGEEPNESYNTAALQSIADSHRFVPDVALHITGLSQRKLAIATTCQALPGAPLNTIILYGGDRRLLVLDRFAEIVANLEPALRGTVKAVGAVAENNAEAADPLNIRSYWPDFDRARNIRTFVPASLCQAVQYCACLENGDVVHRYNALVQAILETLRLAGKKWTSARTGKHVPISQVTLLSFLRLNGMERDFRLLVATFMTGPMPTEPEWRDVMVLLRRLLTIDQETQPVRTYLAFDPKPFPPQIDAEDNGNTYQAANGVAIRVSTIHAVKGETHDATLILETKYRKLFDIGEMLSFILDPTRAAPKFDPAHPTTNPSIRAGFMKKIYVAASRPRNFLCLAMGRERVSTGQREHLIRQRWQILDL